MQPPNLLIRGPSTDPVHDLISSEKYIESLEKKLNKVKGKQSKEPTAKDMISALGKVKEDQMHHLMASPQVSVPCDQCLEDSVVNKTHSGKQQNMEEIVAIIYQDALSKEKDENDDEKG